MSRIRTMEIFEFRLFYLRRGTCVFTQATLALFPGHHLQMDDIEIVLADRNGNVYSDGVLGAQEQYRLVDSFEPTVLRESAGGFAKPFSGDAFSLSAKLGAGVQHILVGDGYVIADDGATPELELVQLESSDEAGAEMEIEASGAINDNVSWSLGANLFYPLVSSVEDDSLDDDEKLNAEIQGKVSVKLFDWANLEYLLTAKRIPLVLNEWQVQNGLVLSLSISTP